MAFGRNVGLDDTKMAHLRDDPLPADVYDDVERTVITYARASTRMEPIGDDLYAALAQHFDEREIVELCFVVGLSNMVNRFHATFLTDVDDATLQDLHGSPVLDALRRAR